MVNEFDGRVGILFTAVLAFTEEGEPRLWRCRLGERESVFVENRQERAPWEGVWVGNVVYRVIVFVGNAVAAVVAVVDSLIWVISTITRANRSTGSHY